jgi:hypothetical protein
MAITVKMKREQPTEVQILEMFKGVVEVCIIGRSPLICNRMSEKAMRELIYPHGRKTTAEKAGSLKHDPWKEFRDSPYTNLNEGPTRLQIPSSMFKGAMRSAAVDLPGATKAQIGRLVYVLDDRIDLYGTPQIMLAVTRSSDIGRTPDVRSRAILPRWACKIRVAFVKPILNETAVYHLIAGSGIMAGLGDWRVGKGSGNYGQYELVSPKDPEFLSILKEGRAEQDAALCNPVSHDDETQSLLLWFENEADKRGTRKDLSIAA